MSVAEEWRAVPSAPGYEVSSLGNARSVRRRVTYSDGRVRVYPEAPLSPSLEGGGYKQVTCGKVGKRKIHRMVAEAFFGPSDLLVLHKNGNRTDNRVENLYYGTTSDNLRDAVRHGTHGGIRKTHCKYGHELTPDNIYWCGKYGTSRRCRICALACARFHERKRAAK
ncbi:NUMOD4 motif-containing HNH endonuclease [Mycobacteroides abscessus]|nr:HNH endonuclease [Mycobacteroides abscessus subsp. massiliense]SHQ53287.1 NUMOD4 motif [Mycobacteroides abscessus subsp. abscessus]SHY11233.1 NUMOD4 motif [Mycobacteroides abscessus subsp. abscessus]SID55016.1 NUMOD4 motif [Mycobacteroides abscessus subsp. abscessus]SIN12039.1 NUMOD4 motif [Mycobacteroides abscessus subsp. abscessus]